MLNKMQCLLCLDCAVYDGADVKVYEIKDGIPVPICTECAELISKAVKSIRKDEK